MNNKLYSILFFAVLASMSGCDLKGSDRAASGVDAIVDEDPLDPRYAAKLGDPWILRQQGAPAYVLKADGLSVREPWGRWTDGDVLTIQFATALPEVFTLEIHTAGAFGGNIGEPVQVSVGEQTQSFVVGFGPFRDASKHELVFRGGGGTDSIALKFPVSSPASEEDPRRLGIALTELRVVSNGS